MVPMPKLLCNEKASDEFKLAVGESLGLPGVPVTVVNDDEAEKADFTVCMPAGKSPFKDNLYGSCSECGRAIMFRPHAPKKPAKICYQCMEKKLEEEAEDEPRSAQ